jgi:hypothetical protein
MSKVRTPSVQVKLSVQAKGKGRVSVRATATATATPEQPRLKFGHGNAKLAEDVHTFSLPAGYACPFAHDCLSRADRRTGRITDGPETVFRCFAASQEARPSVRNARWHNWDLINSCFSINEVVALILDSLDASAKYVRIHVSGDFHSQDMFDSWCEVARRRPGAVFYAYTKSLLYWIRRKDSIPANLVLTASMGGRLDHLIHEHGLRYARVVLSEQEAADLGLELDHDDSHAMKAGPSFALLIHGSQPAGTPAAKAVAALRAQGEYGYGKRADEIRRRFALPVV